MIRRHWEEWVAWGKKLSSDVAEEKESAARALVVHSAGYSKN